MLRRLGAGGVGAVYEIEHQVTRHRRALKILHPRFRAMPEVVERFLREGSAAGRIGNPHIVETFDAGELDNGAPWLLMELLAGEPLSEVLRRAGRLEFGPACGLVAEVALAVQAAHDAGIVHRDLKPDNLYVVERDGRPFVKVLDFGMSKFDSGVTGAVSMTAEGTTLGTPLYMAPEQMRGAKDVDGRADVYALGVILYEALAGGVPYNAASFAELAVLVLGGGCARLETLRPDSPAGLAEVVHRAMAIDPAKRIPTARELADALGPYALIPPASSGWWRVDADVGGLDRTAVRPTPMTPDRTFPSTPSPMPVSPRRVTDAAAQVSAPSSPPLAPPVPSSQTSSGFRRAPSLARRLRRLGLLATVLVVGGVYRQLKGGPDDAPSSRQATAGAVAQAPLGEPTSASEHGESRATKEEPKAKAIPQASRVGSADRAQPSDRAGGLPPSPASPAAPREERCDVTGGLSEDQIESVVTEHVAEVRGCRKKQKGGGAIELHWTIGPDGTVKTPTVTRDNFPDPAVGRCLVEQVKNWKFPPPSGGGTVNVTCPWPLRRLGR